MQVHMQGAWAYAAGGRMPRLQASDLGLQQLLFSLFGLPLGLTLNVVCGGGHLRAASLVTHGPQAISHIRLHSER